ncbi:DUF2304 domain-containing protein [Methanosphaera sp. WGK6]|uniref:DUF2304 domain-containing protein n=1 Tax=Methanosphaera sp. WGK6 TaxID=1561964 RepID=UPI00084C2831|nr:DUF2304 family protein [Methanosphaera sp. WGK6]
MFTYQLLIIIAIIIATIFVSKRFYNDVLSIGLYSTWIILGILVIIAALFPEISIHIAAITGLGRGLDALYIIATLLLFYISFKLFNRIEDQKKRINELVSELALQQQKDDEK